MGTITFDSDMTENTEYEILLMQYAAGCLDQAQSMIITAHLGMSDKGHKILKEYSCVGGSLLEHKCDPVSMGAKSLENVMSQIDCCAQAECDGEQNYSPTLPDGHCLPECVQKNIKTKKPSQNLKWRPFYPGFRIINLPMDCNRSRAHLIKAKPGHKVPSHRHSGLEITLLLDGGMDDHGKHYGAGDLIIHDSNEEPHSPQSCKTKGCVSLTVLSAPVKFTGLASMLNPFVRFTLVFMVFSF